VFLLYLPEAINPPVWPPSGLTNGRNTTWNLFNFIYWQYEPKLSNSLWPPSGLRPTAENTTGTYFNFIDLAAAGVPSLSSRSHQSASVAAVWSLTNGRNTTWNLF
jgi:hypothetical protein